MSQTDLTHQLPDGRTIGYAEYGQPDGRPFFYCHGFPGSRAECSIIHDVAESCGIRLISPDRPGYGLSSVNSGRTLLEWPEDLRSLADALNLESFSIIGMSGGGPYGLACAYVLAERIDSCHIVAGLGPVFINSVRRDMTAPGRIGFKLARQSLTLFKTLYARPMQALSRSAPETLIRMMAVGMCSNDHKALSRTIVRRQLSNSLRETFRQGIQGSLDDAQIYTKDWGFNLGDISCPVQLWHGDADRIVPASHSSYMHSKISNSKLSIIPKEGHFSLPINHADKIFSI